MTEQTALDISVEEVTHAVAEISKMDAVIGALHEKYDKVIFDVETPDGMKGAKAARKEIRDPRYLIENLRKDGKRPILDLGRQLDARAGHMTERLMQIETPIDERIKQEESRAERERQEKIDAELKRVESIQDRIADIRSAAEAALSHSYPAEKLAVFVSDVEKVEVDDWFAEFQPQARDAKDATLSRLRELHTAAVAREEEEARIKAERAELEKLRAANAEREEKERKERAAREAKERAEREAAELEARKKREAEQAEAKAEAERKMRSEQAAKKAKFPGVDSIVQVLTDHYGVTTEVVTKWLDQLRKAA